MNLPQQYAWLSKEPGPKMLIEALKLYGIKEIPGKVNNPVILGWADELGIGQLVNDDEQAWCGLAHGVVVHKSGYLTGPLKGWDLLRAAKWMDWGFEVKIPMLADTMIFHRPGGNHVGLYVFETQFNYGVLGGNQSNMYGITEIDKSRYIGARRATESPETPNVRRIFMDSHGKVSTNES